MKIKFIFLIVLLIAAKAFSQTATNFTVNDCVGVNHDLFTELDAGKVVVLCWVMPCSSCIGPSKTTYNVAQTFNTTHPGRVRMYVCDDYANTSCTSLTSWCTSNGLTNTTKFSNAAIKMSDYGSVGMPKIVVIGNYTHKVYYNANNSVNSTLLNTAITNALNDYFVGVADETINEVSCFPNPATDQVTLSFSSEKSVTGNLTVFDNTGKKVSELQKIDILQGSNSIALPTEKLKAGFYSALIQTGSGILKTKFIIAR